MPTTTQINGLPIALLGDSTADIVTAVSDYATAADSRVIPRFATAAARDAAITAPVAGQMAAVTGTDEIYFYRSSLWNGFGARVIIKNTDETLNNSATLQNDDVLAMSIEANSAYYMHLVLGYSASVVADFKWGFTGPAGYGGNSNIVYLDPGGGTQLIGSYAITSTRIVAAQGVGAPFCLAEEHAIVTTAGTAGTLQVQWAQNTQEATNLVVYASSFLSLLKVG